MNTLPPPPSHPAQRLVAQNEHFGQTPNQREPRKSWVAHSRQLGCTVPSVGVHSPVSCGALSRQLGCTVPSVAVHCPVSWGVLSRHTGYTVPSVGVHCPVIWVALSRQLGCTVPSAARGPPFVGTLRWAKQPASSLCAHVALGQTTKASRERAGRANGALLHALVSH